MTHTLLARTDTAPGLWTTVAGAPDRPVDDPGRRGRRGVTIQAMT
ncbi:hypothetical protein [Streptomyces sp. BK022]|nr:hypothetical protein [Streptomyces sp. BK022]